MTEAVDHHVLIVGSGFAGLCMAIRLKQSGVDDFTVLERADRVGGVWRDNTYPGVACDVPSYLYSFSFAPEHSWSRIFAPQREILAYLERCADRFGVRRHIAFNARVVRAAFDERAGLWEVTTDDGVVRRARVLVSGSGHALSVPVVPKLPGLETFAGRAFHSARWDHGYDLAGRRVAVVGTGASAVQIVPAIAPAVGRLALYQRTAPWVLPRPDAPIAPRTQAFFARRPGAQRLARSAIYWAMEAFALGYVVDPRLNALRERQALRYLAACVRDPDLRAKLTPSFRLGCKRLLFSSDYYAALQRPNAELVTEAITEVRPRAIVTRDGRERPTDAIVFATGFEAAEARAPFRVLGRRGLDLDEAWRAGIEAYLGTTVAGFPNLFLLVGPNTGLGHSSMVFMIESQVAYVLDCIKTLRARDLASVEVRADAQAEYNAWLQKRLGRSVWATGCNSWYLTRGGKNTTAWPGFTFEFRLRTRRFDADRYHLVARAHATAAPRSEATVFG